MILVQNLDLAGILPDRIAEEEEAEFGCCQVQASYLVRHCAICLIFGDWEGGVLTESDTNSHQSGNMQLVRVILAIPPRSDRSDGFDLFTRRNRMRERVSMSIMSGGLHGWRGYKRVDRWGLELAKRRGLWKKDGRGGAYDQDEVDHPHKRTVDDVATRYPNRIISVSSHISHAVPVSPPHRGRSKGNSHYTSSYHTRTQKHTVHPSAHIP